MGELLYAVMDARQVHAENVFALLQIGYFQNVLALQRAVSLQFNCLQLIIPILEKEALGSFTPPDINGTAEPSEQHHSGKNNQSPSDSMLRYPAGADLHIEQVLLAPVAHIGHTPISRPGAFLDEVHLRVPSVLARESAMMRAQRST